MMTFAHICKQCVVTVLRRQTVYRFRPSCTKEFAECSQIILCRWYSLSASANLTRSMQKTIPFSFTRCFSLTASASLVSLLLLSGVRKVNTPQYTSHRNHSDSESDSEGEGSKAVEEPAIMQKPEISNKLKQVKEETVYGMLVADAIAMPVHWYYNPDDIKRGYGNWLTGYKAPNKKHPSSILNLSAVDGSGRGSGSSTPLIGNIILHDKVKFWKESSTHYHQGMSAGDNTLNAVTAIEMLKTMNKADPELTTPDREVRAAVLEDYVKFMTTPGTHNDTYAESFHRSFFKDWVMESTRPTSADDLIEFAEKRTKAKMSVSPDSQLAVIGSFVPAIPWIVHTAHRTESECAKSTVEFIRLTHPVASLVPFMDTYARLLHAVMNGHDLRSEVLKVVGSSSLGGPGKREMVLKLLDKAHQYPKGSEQRLQVYQTATGMLGSACYIDGAMSSMFFLALEFHDDFMGGVLANANCGGENCHRGAALGALLAASAASRGEKIPAVLRDNLHSMKPVAAAVIQDMNNI